MRLGLSMLLSVADLARRKPEEAAERLSQARRRERDRIDQENTANSRSSNTYARAASILIGVGIRPPSPVYRSPATRDEQFDRWAWFADGLVDAYKAMHPLTTTAAVLGKDASVFGRVGHVKECANNLIRKSENVPIDWPDRWRLVQAIRIDAIKVLERGARAAAVSGNYARAGEWFAEAERLCIRENLTSQCNRNRRMRVDVGIHANHDRAALLDLLGEAPLWMQFLRRPGLRFDQHSPEKPFKPTLRSAISISVLSPPQPSPNATVARILSTGLIRDFCPRYS